MNNDIIFNFLLDSRKKKVNPFSRAEAIQSYLVSKKISQRELARELGIPHSTIQDWTLWNRITKSEYDKMIKNGLSHLDIYRTLRDGKKENKEKLVNTTKIQIELESTIKFINKNIKNIGSSQRTKELVLELKELLDKVMLYLDNGKIKE